MKLCKKASDFDNVCTMTIHTIRIKLEHSNPPIWRSVAVPSDLTLRDLHDVIQIVMGWGNEHLYQFTVPGKRLVSEEMARLIPIPGLDFSSMKANSPKRHFGPDAGNPLYGDEEDDASVTLAQVCPKDKSEMTYLYDFGDSWKHLIHVQKITPPNPDKKYPLCVEGQMACPPEDCGGIWGYANLIKNLAKAKRNPRVYEEISERFHDGFDSEQFDIEKVNKRLAACYES